MLDIVMLVVTMIFGIRVLLKRERLRDLRTPLAYPLLCYIIFAAFSSFFTGGMNVRFAGVWLAIPLTYFLSISTLKNKNQLLAVLYFCLFIACGLAIIGVFQHFSGINAAINQEYQSFVVNEKYVRSYATFGSPNPFASYLDLVIPIALALFISEQKKFLSGAALMILTAGLVSTVSRAAILSLALTLVAFYSLLIRDVISAKRKRISVSLLLLAVLPFFINGTLTKRFVGISPTAINELITEDKPVLQEDPNFDIAQRILAIKLAFKMINDFTRYGVGLGEYRALNRSYEIKNLRDLTLDTHVHNMYLQTWINGGFLVFVSFVVSWIIHFVYCLRRIGKNILMLGAFGSFLSFLLIGLFDSHLWGLVPFIFGFVLSIPYLVEKLSREDPHSL